MFQYRYKGKIYMQLCCLQFIIQTVNSLIKLWIFIKLYYVFILTWLINDATKEVADRYLRSITFEIINFKTFLKYYLKIIDIIGWSFFLHISLNKSHGVHVLFLWYLWNIIYWYGFLLSLPETSNVTKSGGIR